jgi:hypothetical protein
MRTVADLPRALALIGALAACAPRPAPAKTPDPAPTPRDPADAVLPYSYEIEAAQPHRPPFLAKFARGDENLSFIAVRHGCDPATFRLIDEALASRPHAFVLIEGTPAARGTNPPAFARHFEEWAASGFCKGGLEAGYVASLSPSLLRSAPRCRCPRRGRRDRAHASSRGWSR